MGAFHHGELVEVDEEGFGFDIGPADSGGDEGTGEEELEGESGV